MSVYMMNVEYSVYTAFCVWIAISDRQTIFSKPCKPKRSEKGESKDLFAVNERIAFVCGVWMAFGRHRSKRLTIPAGQSVRCHKNRYHQNKNKNKQTKIPPRKQCEWVIYTRGIFFMCTTLTRYIRSCCISK